ncbi:MAG: 3-hydroxyacyl-CoA dehydrogenase family protein [Dehalococcoidia bacterium]|nr:3-hydroxyacyl-CoA dehydrogenase family protein [Chloroflexota bacterium]MXZ88531.1 3-hydroxyacyl-CoA dehydrogenase family protein [Dehalococcoidia bacterium]MYI85978.1 3-hydroxyacyl-CoA dehydrogenase family protein [Dehalococcoidia bacterium]
MTIREVGVVGCGIMGAGIAQICAAHGYRVRVTESEPERLEQGLATIKRRLGRDVGRGRLSRERHDRTLARLNGVESLEGFSESDLVIEAVVEDLPVKKELFEQLGEVCKQDAILASNTSSLSLSEMAASSGRPEQVIGIHFFNPPTVLPLVEVISSESTSQETIDAAMAFCDSIDRLTVRVKDSPGFIVNRLLVPFIFDAIHMVEGGIASAEDVDQACKVGLNHALGPLATADLIGLDTMIHISDAMFEEYGEARFKAPTTLRRLVSLGHLGRKSGRGFFEYD